MNLKRLWDTENKKIVWAVNKSDHKKVYQVWTNDDGSKLYIYKDKREELDQTTEDVKEYWPVWKQLTDETVGYYLTSEPTELFNRDEGDEASYQFVNRDWTVLESWKVDEWETPEYTWETPTREATAQYTYTFAGWNPTVWPISKKTIYTATYTATVNKYTITWKDYDNSMLDEQEVDYWATPVYAWETPTRAGYTFIWWTPEVATVTWNAVYTATYEAESEAENATLYLSNTDMELAIYVDDSVEAVQSLTLPVQTDTVFYVNDNILYIGSVNDAEPTHTITVDWEDAEAQFSGWTLGTPDWDITPANNTDYVVWDVMTDSNEVNLYCEYTL